MFTQLPLLSIRTLLKEQSKKFKTFLFIMLILLSMNALAQTNWIKYDNNPILELGHVGSWDEQGGIAGSVIFDGIIYHMWYSGSDGSTFRIGHATSDDGFSWTKDLMNPVLDIGSASSWENYNVFMPSVLLVDSIFHMWYNGDDGYNERIGHATSIDGTNWIKDVNNPVLDLGPSGSWDDFEIFPMAGSVIFIDTMFHLYYGGIGMSQGQYAIGHATSTDGSTWTRNSQNPIMEAGYWGDFDDFGVIPGSVLFDGDTFEMWYSGCDDTYYRYRIGYAFSTDGINWTRDTANNPVIDYGPSGSWDHQRAWYASVLYDDNTGHLKMWYTGGEFYTGRIGYAFDDTHVSIVEQLFQPQSHEIIELQNYPNPFKTSTTIEFSLASPKKITVSVYDLSGKQQKKTIAKHLTSGKHQFEWNASGLEEGIYFVQLKTGKEIISRKLLKLK